MTVFIAGVDPGAITGCSIWNAKGIVDSWQDESWPSIRRLVLWMRENREHVGLIGIEDCFVGKGPHASLMVARSGGRVEGSLVIAGWSPDRIRWLQPSSWRAELGIKGKKSKEKEASAREHAKRLTGRSFTAAETHMAEALCIGEVTWSFYSRNLPRPATMRGES